MADQHAPVRVGLGMKAQAVHAKAVAQQGQNAKMSAHCHIAGRLLENTTLSPS